MVPFGRRRRFDGALLLQNAFDAALIAFLGRIPERAGDPTDGRRILLTLPVPLTPGILDRHEVEYYLCLLDGLGIPRPVPASLKLAVTGEEKEAMAARLALLGIGRGAPVVAINPGATYGSAKRWYPERFAAVADALSAEWGAGVEAAGHSTGDQRPALLRQQPEHPLLRRHQRIQPRRLAVEAIGDGALLLQRWMRDAQRLEVIRAQLHEGGAASENLEIFGLH